MARKRKGMGTEQRCGCRVVRNRIGRGRAAVACRGTPRLKIISKQRAARIRGDFCTKMLKPFPKRGRRVRSTRRRR